MSNPTLLFSLTGTNLSFRAELLMENNPHVVSLVLQHLPITSRLGHVVVAGDTFWMDTSILSLRGNNMVERRPGVIYFYEPGQGINVCYGEVTESMEVNQFAEVKEDDFPNLIAIGQLVHKHTIQIPEPTIIRIDVTLIGTPLTITRSPVASFEGAENGWRLLKATIDKEISTILLEEPDELAKVRLGLIKPGPESVGSMERPLANFVQLKSYLMTHGAGVLYPLIKLAYQKELSIAHLKILTMSLFTHTDFMGDLGLHKLKEYGRRYIRELDRLTTVEEYIELTASLLNYVNRLHRWLHIIFPWHLSATLPHKEEVDDDALNKLLPYVAGTGNI